MAGTVQNHVCCPRWDLEWNCVLKYWSNIYLQVPRDFIASRGCFGACFCQVEGRSEGWLAVRLVPGEEELLVCAAGTAGRGGAVPSCGFRVIPPYTRQSCPSFNIISLDLNQKTQVFHRLHVTIIDNKNGELL